MFMLRSNSRYGRPARAVVWDSGRVGGLAMAGTGF